ncbi:hypothetical protein BD779DRAFT_1668423 [Infundibulicybe gibba]|nr:hypothetical protein BD779DRAFT_1668423 [Infundibulicybe gibba]
MDGVRHSQSPTITASREPATRLIPHFSHYDYEYCYDSAGFDAAFDAFVSTNAKITINGVDTPRNNYKAFLQGEKFLESGATVSFSGAVDVPAEKTKPFDAGAVGLFYTAAITRKIRVRDAPMQLQVTSSLNIIAERDPAIPTPPPSPIHGIFDPRRVMVLNQVIHNGPVSQTQAPKAQIF